MALGTCAKRRLRLRFGEKRKALAQLLKEAEGAKDMAYDEGLTQRVHEVMLGQPALEEKRMFGGVGFLLHGNMSCGVYQDYLIVRVGPAGYEEALAQPHVKVFDITGRAMRGWVMIEPAGLEEDQKLEDWVRRGVAFALTLPPK